MPGTLAPVAINGVELRLTLRFTEPPREIGKVAANPRGHLYQYQRLRPFGMDRGELNCHRTTFGCRTNHGTVYAGVVTNRE